MDSILNIAKQGYSAYESSKHSNNSDGSEHKSNDNSGHQFDHDEVVHKAGQHHDVSGDASLYSNAMGHVNNNQHEHNDEINEEEVHAAHDKAYNKDGARDLSPQAMGGAAALQAFKSFTSGSGGGKGGSKSDLMSLAMAEASKLFDKSGGAASGNKQDVVNGAAMTVMKLLVQSKASSFMGGGGGSSGGMSSLMGLASKFM